MLPTVPSSSIASITLSRLWAGSPMPMNTTLRTGRRMRARATCAMISALPTWRSNPSRPVMQNRHPTAQPTCDETHRPSRGSSTLSTVWPSASATSSRSEPSAPGCTAWMRARPASSASMAGRAASSDDGKKLAGRRRPLLRGSAWDHSRRMRCSWLGPAPASRSRCFSSWIRMRGSSWCRLVPAVSQPHFWKRLHSAAVGMSMCSPRREGNEAACDSAKTVRRPRPPWGDKTRSGGVCRRSQRLDCQPQPHCLQNGRRAAERRIPLRRKRPIKLCRVQVGLLGTA